MKNKDLLEPNNICKIEIVYYIKYLEYFKANRIRRIN